MQLDPPTAGWYVFVLQLIQTLAPVPEYDPCKQNEQGAVDPRIPTAEPGAQVVHPDDKLLAWYVPAAHSVQLEALVTEYAPTGQLEQLDEPGDAW